MIEITPHAEGCILHVRAQPGARKARIVGGQGQSLKVAVTAPAEQGRANQALIEVLRDALNLKRSQLALVSGETSREKRFLVRGLTPTELTSRLSPWLEA
jgi:uncharacterized protein (TIGR00251 family)